MNRKEKARIASHILANVEVHYEEELLERPNGDKIFRWIFVKEDKQYRKVLSELERKKIIDIKDTRGGYYVSLHDYLRLKKEGDYFINTHTEYANNGMFNKDFSRLLTNEYNRIDKMVGEIVP